MALGLHQSVAAGPLAAGWIITTLLSSLPDPYWLVSALSFVFILPVQALANRVNAKIIPEYDTNGRFTSWNIGGITFFIIFSALAIVGLFLTND
jgi:hypothetical protein